MAKINKKHLFSFFYITLTFYLLVCCGSAQRKDKNCFSGMRYEGRPRVGVPRSIWANDFSRSIEGDIDKEMQEELDKTVKVLLTYYPSLSVAVAIPGKGVWSTTQGKDVKNTDSTILFQAASITKLYTAAILLQLVDEGRLSLNDRLSTWFPEIPHADLITIHNLLCHTSGLVSFNALPDGKVVEYSSKPYDIVSIISKYYLLFCPGTQWSYSNSGYLILGLIIEAIENKSFNAVLKKRILSPLSLNNTIFREQNDTHTNIVTGYASGNKIKKIVDYGTSYTAGAIATTAKDAVIFLHALLSGKVISKKAIHASFEGMYPMQPMIPSPPNTAMYYGRGVQYTDAPGGDDGPGAMLGHDGGIVGFNGTVAYLYEDDIYVSLLVNDKDVPAAAGLWKIVQSVRRHR